jgi:hypothetical protein
MKFVIALSLVCVPLLLPVEAVAQRRTQACNELPYAQCVKCAIGRGFTPDRYVPYCRRR